LLECGMTSLVEAFNLYLRMLGDLEPVGDSRPDVSSLRFPRTQTESL